MNNKGLAVILVLMFALAVGAGVVAGKLTARVRPEPVTPEIHRGTLAEELHLTHDQNSQMQTIWQEVNKKSNEWVKEARAIQDDEDKALMERILKTDEQKKLFQDLRLESTRKVDRLEKQRRDAFLKAVEDSKKLLNNDQCRIYDQIIEDKTGSLSDPAGRASEGRH